MPTQAVTSSTCREAVLGAFWPSFVPLDNVVDFPVTARPITPASIFEDDRIATEVAMACRLVKKCVAGLSLSPVHDGSDATKVDGNAHDAGAL